MKAKRGDLIAIITTTHDYVIGQESVERSRVELAVVTSVTRDGTVRKARGEQDRTHDLTRPTPRRSVQVVPDGRVDTERAMTAYAERRYPSAPHSTMVPPFDGLDDLRAFLAEYRRELMAG